MIRSEYVSRMKKIRIMIDLLNILDVDLNTSKLYEKKFKVFNFHLIVPYIKRISINVLQTARSSKTTNVICSLCFQAIYAAYRSISMKTRFL